MMTDNGNQTLDLIQKFNFSIGIPNNVSISALTTKDFTTIEVTNFKIDLNVEVINSTCPTEINHINGVIDMEATISQETKKGIPGHVFLVIYFVIIICLDIWGLIIAKKAREEIDGETFGGGFL